MEPTMSRINLARPAPALALAALLAASTACAPKNPPVVRPVRWDSAETAALARRACADCHSNETVWPWYSRAPVVGALVRADVKRGRAHMNFSDWGAPDNEAEEAPEELAEGDMPLPLYLRAHPEARLSPAERAALIAGLERTLAQDPPEGEGRGGEGRGAGGEEGRARGAEGDVERDDDDDDDDDDGGHGRGRGRGGDD
jgi:hypothetical protein